MDAIFDAVAAWFLSAGLHPVLGSFLAGGFIAYVFALVFRPSRREPPSPQFASPGAVKPQAALFELPANPDASVRQTTRISMTINNVPVDVPDQVLAHIRAGNHIEAIKELRSASGLGLKEAKDVVDMMAKSLPRPRD